MSRPSWLNSLNQTLNRLNKPAPRVAVLGVGHELHGDDAAGLMVARALIAREAGLDRLLIIDAGPAPENTTGALRTFRPDLVLLVDAAQMNEPPGTVRLIAWQDTTGISASTHTLPLHMLALYLTIELACEVALIGLQPFANTLDAPLSPGIQQAVEDVVNGLADVLAGR